MHVFSGRTNYFKKKVTISEKRLYLIPDFAYYIKGGSMLVWISELISNTLLPLYAGATILDHIQIQMFVLFMASLLGYTKIIKAMKHNYIYECFPLLLAIGVGCQIVIIGHYRLYAAVVLLTMVIVYTVSILLGIKCIQAKLNANVQILFHVVFIIGITFVVWIHLSTSGLLLLYGSIFTHNIQMPLSGLLTTIFYIPLFNENDLHPVWIFFYAFNFIHGIWYLTTCVIMSLIYPILRFRLAKSLNLNYKQGYKSIDHYFTSTYKRCIKDSFSAEDLRIQHFAINCLNSISAGDRLEGLRLMHAIVATQDQ